MAASSASELEREIPPFLRIYKDGRVEKTMGFEVFPAGIDPRTGVQSKDVAIAQDTGVSARIYLPKTASPGRKLPLLIYFHGGGFVVQSPFSPIYHHHLNSLVSEAEAIAVSVDYRLAPEHLLPAAYEDSWTAIQWVTSHAGGDGPEPWLNQTADFARIYMCGDSAGANITHNMAIRVGSNNPNGFKLSGIILDHPMLWGKEPVGSETVDLHKKRYVEDLWHFVNPTTTGVDDPMLNPAKDPNLSKLGCTRVLIWVGQHDPLRDRGWYYHECLKKSGWGGEVEILESKEEGHVFHLIKPHCDNALAMLKKKASFINHGKP